MNVTSAADHVRQLMAFDRRAAAVSQAQAQPRPEAGTATRPEAATTITRPDAGTPARPELTAESTRLQTLDAGRNGFQQGLAREIADTGSAAREVEGSRPGRLEQLLSDWGKSDSRWDLNKDGKVGVQDLLRMLARMATIQQRRETPAPMPEPGVPQAEAVTPEARTEEPSPLEQLLSAWGQTGSDFDLNGDGVVGTADLLTMLQKMASKEERDTLPGPPNIRDVPLHAPTTRAAFEHAARSLMQRFDPSRPADLFSAVEDSNLGPQQKQHLLSRLAELAPRGLQVSTVA